MRGVFLKIKDVMIKIDLRLKENNTFYETAQLFSDNDVEIIPILDKKESLVGIITKNDIIKNFVNGTSHDMNVKYLMRRKINIINEDSKILDYIDATESYMAVKNVQGKFVGIYSMNNICKKGFVNALEKISELKKKLNCIHECGMIKLNCTELDEIIESSYDGI